MLVLTIIKMLRRIKTEGACFAVLAEFLSLVIFSSLRLQSAYLLISKYVAVDSVQVYIKSF